MRWDLWGFGRVEDKIVRWGSSRIEWRDHTHKIGFGRDHRVEIVGAAAGIVAAVGNLAVVDGNLVVVAAVGNLVVVVVVGNLVAVVVGRNGFGRDRNPCLELERWGRGDDGWERGRVWNWMLN